MGRRPGRVLPVVLGISDGILTALTLTAGRLTHPAARLTFGLALRVALAALLSGAFVFFVARYADLRSELLHAENELNLTEHGRLATTRLGRTIAREAAVAALLSSGFSFVGALVPIMPAVLFGRPFWLGIPVTIGALGVLGLVLGRVLSGRPFWWSLILMAAGGLLSVAGVKLDLM